MDVLGCLCCHVAPPTNRAISRLGGVVPLDPKVGGSNLAKTMEF
jgi:hypothetical protein